MVRTSVFLSFRSSAQPGPWVVRATQWVEGLGQGSQGALDAAGAGAPREDPVTAALAFALELGPEHPYPGEGRTAEIWELLATVAAVDLGAARALEPHLDAMAILAQAGLSADFPADATWGVFAAEGGPAPLVATPGRAGWGAGAGSFALTGTKLWCSLADRLDRALVSAAIAPGASAVASSAPPARGLFAVDLRQPGVTVEPGAWHARGLAEVPSGPVRFDAVAAEPIGEPGWYLSRPGFSWGGIGVAACWFGGAVGVARTLATKARTSTDPVLLMHLGAVDERLEDARRALAEAATLIDLGHALGDTGELLAKRARATVASASEEVLRHVAHALGPAPLALDAIHSKRVADLELYVRQHHAEKDLAALGAHLAGQEQAPW